LNNYDLAKSYIRQAEERIKHAKEALNEGKLSLYRQAMPGGGRTPP